MRNRGPMRRACVVFLITFLVVGWGAHAVRAGEEDTTVYWLSRAEILATEIDTPEARAALLVSIGTRWVEAGDMGRARQLLAAAAAFGRKCTGCFAKAQRLADLAVLRYRAGDVMGSGKTFCTARDACDELEDPVDQVRALAYVASRRAQAGESMLAQVLYGEASHLASSLPPEKEAAALAELVSIQAGVGDLVRMGRTLARLKTVPCDENTLAGAWLEAATAGIAAGKLDAARGAVDLIEIDPLRLCGVLMLARAHHEAGHMDEAVANLGRATALAESLTSKAGATDAYVKVAQAARLLGDESVARQMRKRAKRTALKSGGSARMAAGLIAWADLEREAGRPVAARAALKALTPVISGAADDPVAEAGLRSNLASALVRAGASLCAECLLADIEDPARRVRARLDLADAYRGVGNAAQALVICGHQLRAMAYWPEELASDRAESMRRIAVMQAACGRRALAARTVTGIDKPWHAATACTYIARDL